MNNWHFQLIKRKDSNHISLHMLVTEPSGESWHTHNPAWVEGTSVGQIKNLLRKISQDIDTYGVMEIEGEQNED